MNAGSGTYALVLRCAAGSRLQVGRWGVMHTRSGYYVYVGSAFGPGGVAARVARHCRQTKAGHWHIDYLRQHVDIAAVWFSHAAERLEHRWAGVLADLPGTEPVAGFGCSDCGCGAHLFFFRRVPRLAPFVRAVGGPVRASDCAAMGRRGTQA